jgi:hypothetical protein
MAKLGGRKAWIAAGVALLVGLAIVPAFSGAASAATVSPAATPSPATSWAYGGQGWSNNTLILGNTTITYDSMFGWTVIFTVTHDSGAGVWTLEEQRTLGITITATVTTPKLSATYHFHGQEVDVGFVNITNQSTVYVNDQGVPALGIVNASVAVSGLIDESLAISAKGVTHSASLDVTGTAQTSTSFSPSLGLIPLNLSGVNQWNSTATASPSASWDIAYTYTALNGTSGSGYKTGSLSASGPVTVTGYKVAVTHPFSDGKTRIGVLLIIQGPFDCYDGFLLVPHDFDLFGTATHSYGSLELGSAGISSEELYLSAGPGGLAVTAADQTFSSADTAANAEAAPSAGPAPAAAPSSPSATVEGQPMSVAEAQEIDHSLTNVPGSAGASVLLSVLDVALIGLAAAAIVGTIGVIEWRSYARRRSKGGLVGGYGENWTNGVPPASALPPTTSVPSGPERGSGPAEDPNRRL